LPVGEIIVHETGVTTE
jgi:hypothetical protein